MAQLQNSLYFQDTMVSPPVKLGVPLLFKLYTNPPEGEAKPSTDTWIIGPALKMVADFEASLKRHPLIDTPLSILLLDLCCRDVRCSVSRKRVEVRYWPIACSNSVAF
jgi:hypothetical protein